MASYTIRLKDLLDSGFNIWDNERPYPIYDETHRNVLNKLIEDHYYMREIGFEVPRTFSHYLNTRMREIMPKYNAMYASIPQYDPDMLTFREVTETDGKNNSNTKFEKGKETFHKGAQTDEIERATDYHYNFDTPMNASSIQATSPDHMSSANRDDIGKVTNRYGLRTDERDSYTDTTDVGAQDHRKTDRYGTNQSVFETIKQYREFEYNIDKMIIDELEDLFMMVF